MPTFTDRATRTLKQQKAERPKIGNGLPAILDGFDGYFARLLRSSSSFGELFDQEVDNFMMLTLATSLYLNINIPNIN